MTDKQKRFADEYLIDLNGTRAYKVAYPHVKNDETASAGASRALRNVKLKKYIDERNQAISDDRIATADEVMRYLTSVMRGKETDEKQSENGIIAVQVQTRDRLKAGELLAKRFGLDKPKEDNEAIQKLDEILDTIKGVI